MAAIWLPQSTFNPIALRKAKIVLSFGLSECSRVEKAVYFKKKIRGAKSLIF